MKNISADREENSDTDEDVNPEVRLNQDLNHQMNLRPRQPINDDETNYLTFTSSEHEMKFICEYTFYFQIVYLYEHVYVYYSIKPFNIVLIYMLNMIIIVLTDLYVT